MPEVLALVSMLFTEISAFGTVSPETVTFATDNTCPSVGEVTVSLIVPLMGLSSTTGTGSVAGVTVCFRFLGEVREG